MSQHLTVDLVNDEGNCPTCGLIWWFPPQDLPDDVMTCRCGSTLVAGERVVIRTRCDDKVLPEIRIYDFGSIYNPNGYYVVTGGEVIGIALCRDCADNGDRLGASLAGDDWEPISYHHEPDAPVHCDSCEALIVTSLTPDGHAYIQEAIEEWNTSGRGRFEVLEAWDKTWPQIQTQPLKRN
jgi:hypothetical protein